MADKKTGVYGNTPGDTGFRRKWDLDEFAKRAEERDRNGGKLEKPDRRKRDEEGEPVEEELLQARNSAVDLTYNLNKTQIVQSNDNQQPGFYCKECDCTLKDSVSYLDHINGARHQKNLGMSMKVERSSVDQVRARLANLKRKTDVVELDFDARVEKAKAEEEEEKRAKRREKKEKKRKHQHKERPTEEEGDDTPVYVTEETDMATLMGFGGFGSGKKK
ncbi:zinc finger, matrin-type 2 [Thoreauomyces humboldtii]|nr:zinc finger, matrin-type 2 [Thoreauomyces humboldtii]